MKRSCCLPFLLVTTAVLLLQPPFDAVLAFQQPYNKVSTTVDDVSRRSVFLTPAATAAAAVVATVTSLPTPTHAAQPNGLPLTTAPVSGLKWTVRLSMYSSYNSFWCRSTRPQIRIWLRLNLIHRFEWLYFCSCFFCSTQNVLFRFRS